MTKINSKIDKATQLESIGSLEDFEDGRTVIVKAGKKPLAISRIGDEIFAVDARCTHARIFFAAGRLVDGDVIECPMHGAQFSCRDGAVLLGPATVPLRSYDVKTKDEKLFVNVNEDTGDESVTKTDIAASEAKEQTNWGNWGGGQSDDK